MRGFLNIERQYEVQIFLILEEGLAVDGHDRG